MRGTEDAHPRCPGSLRSACRPRIQSSGTFRRHLPPSRWQSLRIQLPRGSRTTPGPKQRCFSPIASQRNAPTTTRRRHGRSGWTRRVCQLQHRRPREVIGVPSEIHARRILGIQRIDHTFFSRWRECIPNPQLRPKYGWPAGEGHEVRSATPHVEQDTCFRGGWALIPPELTHGTVNGQSDDSERIPFRGQEGDPGGIIAERDPGPIPRPSRLQTEDHPSIVCERLVPSRLYLVDVKTSRVCGLGRERIQEDPVVDDPAAVWGPIRRLRAVLGVRRENNCSRSHIDDHEFEAGNRCNLLVVRRETQGLRPEKVRRRNEARPPARTTHDVEARGTVTTLDHPPIGNPTTVMRPGCGEVDGRMVWRGPIGSELLGLRWDGAAPYEHEHAEGCGGELPQPPRLEVRPVNSALPYFPNHLSNHPCTSRYHSSEFFGFSTQWFSSGKYTSRAGTPLALSTP